MSVVLRKRTLFWKYRKAMHISICRTKMEETPQHCLSRLPDNSALKQQELPAHRLYFTARRVLFVFFTTGIFCLCMGIILILSARSTQEIEINYTRICANCAKLRENASNFDKECTCSIPFYLSGKMMAVEDCAPFKMSDNKTPIVPCGAIANSMFNDTIILSHNINSSVQIKVPMLKSGLTWWTDKYVKFQNPSSKNLADEFRGTTKPPNWPKPIYDLDKKDPRNNGFLNDDFIVWMRAAAFPTFKKLYGRLNRTHHFIEGLPAGNYSFNIIYSILSYHFSFWR
ncbi:PREDICTED: cell cycle control protein 50C isoform X2 [Cercocebus atys]|uniref:cell cycle control protein 50C isoform X2 n=1 Tax=Cercocebus atys TaxID=9531 RepID=UPI0005F58B03|nr:PREDICTED: cell cycle control protein 50C isoform X2 [Cercocebus atys]